MMIFVTAQPTSGPADGTRVFFTPSDSPRTAKTLVKIPGCPLLTTTPERRETLGEELP